MRQRTRFLHAGPLVGLALTLLLGCGGGGSDPGAAADAGYKALGTNDYASAQDQFAAALDGIENDTSHPVYVKAKLGLITTFCRTDPDRAKADLLELAEALPDKVTERTYADIAGRLGDAGNFPQAVALLEAGKERSPGSTVLDGLGKKLVKQAEQAGATDALDALKGLGYTGD